MSAACAKRFRPPIYYVEVRCLHGCGSTMIYDWQQADAIERGHPAPFVRPYLDRLLADDERLVACRISTERVCMKHKWSTRAVTGGVSCWACGELQRSDRPHCICG